MLRLSEKIAVVATKWRTIYPDGRRLKLPFVSADQAIGGHGTRAQRFQEEPALKGRGSIAFIPNRLF